MSKKLRESKSLYIYLNRVLIQEGYTTLHKFLFFNTSRWPNSHFKKYILNAFTILMWNIAFIAEKKK